MKDLTQGRIDAHLSRMGGALLLNMLAGSLLSLLNLYWFGRLGPQAQAAVTLTGIPAMLLLSLMPIVSMGAGILISHAVGAQDRERANRIFNEAFGASFLVIALFGVVAWTQRERFGAMMSPDPATAGLIVEYFHWFVPSMMVQLPLFVLSGALEFTGNVRAGTLAQSAIVVLNALLTPLLMFGWLGLPALGITGAGLASFVACGGVMLAMLVYCTRADAYLRMRPAVWLSRPRELWSALRIGLPIGLESSLVAGYLLAIVFLLRPFGPAEQAAFGIGHRVFQATLMPLMALSGATSILVGQCFGAGLRERIREALRSALTISLTLAPVMLLVIELFAPRIGRAFSDDTATIAAAALFLRIGALTLIPSAFAYIVFAVLSGTGNTRPGLYTQIAYAALVVVPAFVLSRLPGFAPLWLWITIALAGGAQALLAGYFLRRQFTGGRIGAMSVTAAPELTASTSTPDTVAQAGTAS